MHASNHFLLCRSSHVTMTSNSLIALPPQPTTLKRHSHPFPIPKTTLLLPQPLPKTLSISSSSAPLFPPSTREEAISQAKSCLSSTLQKPLNNPLPLPTSKLKRQRQPRLRVEIPVADDNSLTALTAELFADLPVTKKGSSPSLLLLWPSLDLAFASSGSIRHSDIASAGDEILSSADLAVFLAPEASMLEEIRVVADFLSPKPVVLFNPKWGFEEEKGFDPQVGSFVGSFDVVYSFMGLEVRGLLSRRKGVVFKWVRDGGMSGEGWVVMVEEEGELKVVSRFKRRPAIGEVESVLYNLMGANSPVTKSVRFIRDLASNITGKQKG